MNISGSDLCFPRLLYLHPVKFADSLCHRSNSRNCTGPISEPGYTGKTVSIRTKSALWGHHHFETHHTRLANSLSYVWRFARTCITNAFCYMVPIFHPAHHGLQMPPKLKVKVGEFWRHRRPLHDTTATNSLT